jgi:3-oxoacyl-[acyl-carrier protein] reductase
MDLEIRGRVAMVAAASKGIGKGIARALLGEGARVSICSRSPESLEAARAELEEAAGEGGQILAFPCDVSKPDDLTRWHETTVRDLGPVEILVTNTGGPPAARFLDLSEAQWQSGVESTLMNVVRLSRLVLPGMRERRWGRIVHLTSFVAKQPVDLLTISSTLRAGLSALTRAMASQFASYGISVNAVLPGHVMTDRQVHLNEIRSREEGIPIDDYARRVQASIPMGRYGTTREIGDVVAFLCSERGGYVTGVSLPVDGGVIQSTF